LDYLIGKLGPGFGWGLLFWRELARGYMTLVIVSGVFADEPPSVHPNRSQFWSIKDAILGQTIVSIGQRLLVFRRLTFAPSKERGRCLLTKLDLAQFTARLFWRLAGDWCRAFNIFDALSPRAVAACYA
jgi:hypothetical protein